MITMKRMLGLVPLLLIAVLCNAQYSKEKLTDILTGGSAKAWTVKTSNAPEKAFSFNKNQTVEITKSAGVQKEQWSLSSADNIRWFITIGSKKQELIVSYDK